MPKKYEVHIIESERGWGQRLDEVMFFDTQTDADQFVSEFNSVNTLPDVPDWYMYARLINPDTR